MLTYSWSRYCSGEEGATRQAKKDAVNDGENVVAAEGKDIDCVDLMLQADSALLRWVW